MQFPASSSDVLCGVIALAALDRIKRVLENGLCVYWGLTVMPTIYPNDISVRMQLWIGCV